MAVPNKGEQVRLPVTDLAFGGMGVGKIDDFVIFVSGALPGEDVTAEIIKRKKNYAEARIIQIDSPSPDRIEPRCKHFPLCGGCRLQHLAYEKQAEYKRSQIHDSLKQVGGLSEIPEIKLILSKQPFYYRNKMEYSFGLSADNELQLGLHPRGRWGRVFDVEECFLQSEQSAAIVAAVRKAAQELSIPAYDQKCHEGLLRYCMIREGKRTGQRMVNLVTLKSAESEIGQILQRIDADRVGITSVVNNVNTRKATIAYGEYEYPVLGDPFIYEEISGTKFKISANSFFQTNSLTAESLFAEVAEFAGCQGNEKVLDLYCGTGSISFSIQDKVQNLIGVDSESSAIEDAITNRDINGIGNCEFYVYDSLDYLKIANTSGQHFDVVIADPPRAGMHPKMIPQIAQLNPPKLVYVSCNPPALARDCADLIETGYRLERLTCLDMFPQTPHIEAVALFTRPTVRRLQ
ncbi:MAG: 23S rRNA (uracil(1939)-C(5))-methyltransferase RlmD [candidate division Zixibacteria bacterium]|nr:23S rRNA (uracil(1939)-C(5))-methyltransferase RlmD [candidate division Zixibacteria bacterium]